MGSPSSPIVANLYMENFEVRAISKSPHPPLMWKKFVDDTFVVIKAAHKQEFLEHINSIDPHIQCTSEDPRPDGSLPFLDMMITPKEDAWLSTTVYRRPTHTNNVTWPLIALNVADRVCVYFYNFNHKNFYQGIQKFTYSIMNMLRQQNDRIKWILCIISLGFLVFYFITLWESLRDNLLVHRPRPIHYSYNRQQLLNIYSTVRSVSSYNTISKTCWRKLRVYRLNMRRKTRRGKRGTGNKWNNMLQYQHPRMLFHARIGLEKENLVKINTNINRWLTSKSIFILISTMNA